jgi:DNA transformation protein
MKRRTRSAEPFVVRRRDDSREWIEERLADVPELEVRRLFSGVGIYSADAIFGIYWHGRLFFKVDGTSVEDFRASGAEPFCPRPGQTLGRYYEVPSDVADDDNELLVWARRAIVAARETSAQRPKARARTQRTAKVAKRRKKAPRGGSGRG